MAIESQEESFLLPRFRKLVSSKSLFVGKELMRSLQGHSNPMGKITDVELTDDGQSLIIETEQAGGGIVLLVSECLSATVDEEEGHFSIGSRFGEFSA